MGSRAGEAIIEAVQAGTLSFDLWDRVMGIDQSAASRFGLSKAQAMANLESIQEAKKLLTTMETHDFAGMRRWFEDEIFAHRMIAYYQVGRHRLVAAGVPLSY